MSSILDALRKLEAAQIPVARQPGVWTEPPRKRRRAGAGIVAAFVAGVGLTLWLAGHQERAPAEPRESHDSPDRADVHRTATPAKQVRDVQPGSEPPGAPAPPGGALPTAAVAPAAVAAPAPAAPQVVVGGPAPVVATLAGAPAPAVARQPEPPAAPAAALPPAAPAPPLPQALVEAEPPRGRVVPTATPPVAVAARPPEPSPERAPADDGVLPRPPAGAPHIQLSFLVYSSVPERRTVALSVDGGGMMTLHEGDSARDVEVERIFADRVQVRHGGRSFTVRTRD